ncbi:hypothetical protein C8F04DRAFT_1185635 [Mycena alexandri]|uniref:Uncharacterized protein n=1 Tax=Mycena alexandri TaxID=1745969 RepID=A0AAD6WY56_9AGAR|nr:hypothetical protein C8F04DRAFT_1185635 [Mycena alexandri]
MSAQPSDCRDSRGKDLPHIGGRGGGETKSCVLWCSKVWDFFLWAANPNLIPKVIDEKWMKLLKSPTLDVTHPMFRPLGLHTECCICPWDRRIIGGLAIRLTINRSKVKPLQARGYTNYYGGEWLPLVAKHNQGKRMTSGESQFNSNVYTSQVRWFIMCEDPYLWRPGRKYVRPTLIKRRVGIHDMVVYSLCNVLDQYLMVHRQRTRESLEAKKGSGDASERLSTSSRLPRVSEPSMNRVARIAVNLSVRE